MVKYLLDKRNHKYEVVDCTDDPSKREEAYKLSGSMIFPVVVIGDRVVSGGNMPLITSMLQ
jgi:glutaredoxin